jgi:AraC family transcriptional regulator, regulatory protein of adaptative response / DNA-3-methyladenine glycosylase II
VQLTDDQRYTAIQGRDRRFDGWFVVAVTTTGIYCRPSCPAVTPKRCNVEFYAAAAAAQQRGFRACKRCRPDATPGSPEWNVRADVVARAMRLIADGFIDRHGVPAVAARLGYSERQLNRLLHAELGASPLALARAQRAHTARVLIETTNMPITEVAFAAGFASVRQFNDTVQQVYATTPTAMRSHRRAAPVGTGSVALRLAYRAPLASDHLLGFFRERAVAGVEEVRDNTYRRSLRLAGGNAVAELTPSTDAVHCVLHLDNLGDTQAAVQRCRRMYDLDADPHRVDDHLANDPVLAPLVRQRPGLRSPGHPDGPELLVRAVLGQQVSVRGARTLAGRLVAAAGEPLKTPVGSVTHLFPDAIAIANLSPDDFAMPKARSTALIELCRRVAHGDIVIDAGSDRAAVRAQLQAVRGIGPWTAGYVAMRALNDPNVFLPTDIGVRNALVAAGVDGSPKAAAARAEAWQPWSSYALHHLWASLGAP